MLVTSKGQAIDLSLQNYDLKLKTKQSGTDQYADIDVLKRADFYNIANTRPVIEIKFESNPQGKPEGNYVKIDSQQVQFIYRIALITRL